MLTIQLAAELRDHGICVNAVNPGLVRTDLNGNTRGVPVEQGALPAVEWPCRRTVEPAPSSARTGRSRGEFGVRRGAGQRGVPAQFITDPPSTTTVCPVMKSLSADNRKQTMPVRSSGIWSRGMQRDLVVAVARSPE